MIAEKTGWSYRDILYRVSWINLRLMLADAPGYRYDRSSASEALPPPASDHDLRNLANTINGR